MKELVSVVMCVKNGARYLAQAMDSVVAQDYRRVEILLVDGGSTDQTLDIAAGYPLCRSIAQRGDTLPDAYNTGIHEAES